MTHSFVYSCPLSPLAACVLRSDTMPEKAELGISTPLQCSQKGRHSHHTTTMQTKTKSKWIKKCMQWHSSNYNLLVHLHNWLVAVIPSSSSFFFFLNEEYDHLYKSFPFPHYIYIYISILWFGGRRASRDWEGKRSIRVIRGDLMIGSFQGREACGFSSGIGLVE